MIELRGQHALITGGARRLGRAIALRLAEAGVHVVIHHNRSHHEAGTLCDELRAFGVDAWTLHADFTIPAEYEHLISRAVAVAGSLEILINNASIFPAETLETVDRDSVMRNLEVNAWVPFVLARALHTLGTPGQIINLLDARLRGYDWGHVGYIWSKHVFAEMTRMMALAYAPTLRVNAVAPGLILPPEGQDTSDLQRLVHTVPLARHGSADDIAEAVLYLLRSDFLAGEVLYLDGGRHLRQPIGE